MVLAGFATPFEQQLLADLDQIVGAAPFRHLITPGGQRMSVAMTNCGPFGWISDRRGYRYTPDDPESQRPWPEMPASFRALAADAAREAGFAGYAPDACLINRYEPGARLSLHVDKDERDREAPIVSVSLGLPATFLWGGLQRGDSTRRIGLSHGDVVVWGGPSRMHFHGVLPLPPGVHPLTGSQRLNLTFRKVL